MSYEKILTVVVAPGVTPQGQGKVVRVIAAKATMLIDAKACLRHSVTQLKPLRLICDDNANGVERVILNLNAIVTHCSLFRAFIKCPLSSFETQYITSVVINNM